MRRSMVKKVLTILLCSIVFAGVLYKSTDFSSLTRSSKPVMPTPAFNGNADLRLDTEKLQKLKNKFYNQSTKQKKDDLDRLTDSQSNKYLTGKLVAKSSHDKTLMSDMHHSQDNHTKHRPWLISNIELPYNASVVRHQQIQRHSRIERICKSLPEHRPFTTHTYVYELNDLLYCQIHKVGSTNILRLLCWLVGPSCSNIKDLRPHDSVPQFLKTVPMGIFLDKDRTEKFFSFALVRNPWKRLVSVYIQKFIETKQGYTFCKLYDRYPHIKSQLQKSKQPLPFKDYLSLCVIGQWQENGIRSQNEHWRPQTNTCEFCYVNYTFIGKIETMKQDERVILQQFGFQDIDKTIRDANDKLLPNEKAKKTTLLYKDLWADVEEGTLDALREIYKIDFSMFNYPTSPL